jgi:hypothetical protein
MPTRQLRDYRIALGHLDDFVGAWRSGVRPLRERLGFRVEWAWTAPEESRFVWMLSFDGSQAEFEERDRAYYGSDERRALDPDPAQWIEETRHAFVHAVE